MYVLSLAGVVRPERSELDGSMVPHNHKHKFGCPVWVLVIDVVDAVSLG